MLKPRCGLCGQELQEGDKIEEARVVQRISGGHVTTDRTSPREFKHFFKCPPPPPGSSLYT
jgi:hypothetical protein